ncbi:PfhB2, partial [Pasteurella multocida subsp. multocida str. Anand1_buffalo]
DETDSVSVKNPIYESADAVVPTPRSRNVDSADLVDNPLYASASTKQAFMIMKTFQPFIAKSVIIMLILFVKERQLVMSLFIPRLMNQHIAVSAIKMQI